MDIEKLNIGPAQRVFALLGKREIPADGVTDYCNNLAEALRGQGVHLVVRRVLWFEGGWLKALKSLWRGVGPSRGDWAVVHYTALGWSVRGFPIGVLLIVLVLRLRRVRCGIVMHEPWHQGFLHHHIVNDLRAAFQDVVIRSLHRLSTRTIFTIPVALVGWVRASDSKSVFIPLGPNVPETLSVPYPPRDPGVTSRTISVFCLSPPPALQTELDDILNATRVPVSAGLTVRIVFMGRGTDAASAEIVRKFDESGIEVEVLGLQAPESISDAIAHSDVLLCVRGTLNLRRGSALAGIACGVPVVGYSGDEHGTPLVEAGVSLVPMHDKPALGAAVARILLDDSFAREMHLKNLATQRKYFSWNVVARQYVKCLSLDRTSA
jgi:glycosyltransferase involved in cell wall biosynthesis